MLLLDEARNRRVLAARDESSKLLADHAVEERLLGRPRSVAGD